MSPSSPTSLALAAAVRPPSDFAPRASRTGPSKRMGPDQRADPGACQNDSTSSATAPVAPMPATSPADTVWTLLPKSEAALASPGSSSANSRAARRERIIRVLVAQLGSRSRLLRRHRGSARLHLAPAVVDRDELPGVPDVLERVCLEDEEVGSLPGLQRAAIGSPDHPRAALGPGHEPLHRREPRLHHPLELAVLRPSGHANGLGTRIGPEPNPDARALQLVQVARAGGPVP